MKERTMNGMKGIFGNGWLGAGLLLAVVVCIALAGPSPRAGDGRIPIYQAGTISSAGNYYLTQDISGTGLMINADNVSIDLNGFTITSTWKGIRTNGGWTNMRVTNGTISAVNIGIDLQVTAGGFCQVDHVRIASATYGGIIVTASSSYPPPRAVVEHNTIVSVTSGVGISLSSIGSGVVRQNFISGIQQSSASGVGIHLYYCNNILVTENTISTSIGVTGGDGIYLDHSNGSQVTRNTCSTNGGSGIMLFTSYYNDVSWNTASSNGAWGIQMAASTGNVYSYNHTPGNSSGGISPGSGNTDGGGNY